MSRRRKSLPYPKRPKDAIQKRLRFVCTHGGSTHVQFLREYTERVVPGRPDLGGVMRTIDAASVQDKLPDCPTCGRAGFSLDGEGAVLVRRVLDELAEPGVRVLRFDVSTGRLL